MSLSKLIRRHDKLLNDIELVRKENTLKIKSNIRLVNSMQAMRLENEDYLKQIDELHNEAAMANSARLQSERTCADLRQSLAQMEVGTKELNKKVVSTVVLCKISIAKI